MTVIKKFLSVSFLMILAACGSETQKKGTFIETVVPVVNPELVKGRVDVYTSMARGVKYNTEAMVPELRKKVLYNKEANPRAVVADVLKMKSMSQNPLYDNLRALDFAIIYAAANLSSNEQFVSDYLNAKASQTLALAAIKAHKDALFAQKKIKEIDRMTAKQQREVNLLAAKQNRSGILSSADEAYKKGLEVVIYKLAEMKQKLENDVILYRQLAKVDDAKLELEGRRFYELDDLDAKLGAEDFFRSAYENRMEFSLQQELPKKYDYEQLRIMARQAYPQVERLEINGYNAEDPVYLKELQQRATFQSNYLVDKVWQYGQAANNGVRKQLRQEAFEEMSAAILTQNEIAYNVVKRADIDNEEINKRIAELKKVIAQGEKRYRPGNTQKVDLLEQKVALLNLEQQASQMLAERAVALRALYFYAGFNPFSPKLKDGKIKDISSALKTGFNKDMIEMLAQAPLPQTPIQVEKNDWAKKENWLEALVEGKLEPKSESVSYRSYAGNFDLYEGAQYDKKTVMQLGSYREKANADLDWKMLKQLYPELQRFSPVVEKAQVGGRPMYRLVVRQPGGGLKELCNKLRQDKTDCLLR